MTKRKTLIYIAAATLAALSNLMVMLPFARATDLVIIAHKDVPFDSLTVAQVKKIWLGKTRKINGAAVMPADLPKGTPAREMFYGNIVGKTEAQLSAYWMKIVFSGKGTPPKIFNTSDDILGWVSTTPGALAYLEEDAVNDSVKTIALEE